MQKNFEKEYTNITEIKCLINMYCKYIWQADRHSALSSYYTSVQFYYGSCDRVQGHIKITARPPCNRTPEHIAVTPCWWWSVTSLLLLGGVSSSQAKKLPVFIL